MTNLFLFVAGLAILVLGADLLIRGASQLARRFGLSPLVIGLTVVAMGTSAPEVAVTIDSALNGNTALTLGNVVGSCTFNLLGCLGLGALVAPGGIAVPEAVMSLDIWVMLATFLACLPAFMGKGQSVTRWKGALFFGYYAIYLSYLVLAAQSHDALEPFSSTLMGIVIPITIITLVISLVTERDRQV